MASPLLLHIPHASTRLPEADLVDFCLSPAAVHRELLRLTDWHADELFASGFSAEQIVRADISRLVVDVERFADDAQEVAAKVGMGATYVRTSRGETLRVLTPARRAELLEHYYWPHHRALDALAAETLARFGRCLILDAHTYPAEALPTQAEVGVTPEIVLGTEGEHTSPGLRAFAEEFFLRQGLDVAIDRPFRGAIVPNAFYGNEPRVQSVMVEVRRDLYLDETTGERGRGFGRVQKVLTEFREQLEDFALVA